MLYTDYACVARERRGGVVKAWLYSNYADTDFIITVYVL